MGCNFVLQSKHIPLLLIFHDTRPWVWYCTLRGIGSVVSLGLVESLGFLMSSSSRLLAWFTCNHVSIKALCCPDFRSLHCAVFRFFRENNIWKKLKLPFLSSNFLTWSFWRVSSQSNVLSINILVNCIVENTLKRIVFGRHWLIWSWHYLLVGYHYVIVF